MRWIGWYCFSLLVLEGRFYNRRQVTNLPHKIASIGGLDSLSAFADVDAFAFLRVFKEFLHEGDPAAHRIQFRNLLARQLLHAGGERSVVAKAVEEFAAFGESESAIFCELQNRQALDGAIVVAALPAGPVGFGKQSGLFVEADSRCLDTRAFGYFTDGRKNW